MRLCLQCPPVGEYSLSNYRLVALGWGVSRLLISGVILTTTKSQKLDIPERLLNIPDPPKQLFYRGKIPDYSRPMIAIVGTRRPTNYGVEVTKHFARELAVAGATTVSGLALGVDAIVHRSTLQANGTTIAVLPHNMVYPRTNDAIGAAILKNGGTFISEYSAEAGAVNLGHFVKRNRLVSGLADALLITEAAQKSGTTSTANFALDQGKTVMVVPGNITSAMSKGTNNLIKEGALPVTCVEDVLEILGLNQQTIVQSYQPENDHETRLLKLIQDGLRDRQELLIKSGLEAAVFNSTLTKFEILKIV